eukprot:4858192-Amphidinium_carterae.1
MLLHHVLWVDVYHSKVVAAVANDLRGRTPGCAEHNLALLVLNPYRDVKDCRAQERINCRARSVRRHRVRGGQIDVVLRCDVLLHEPFLQCLSSNGLLVAPCSLQEFLQRSPKITNAVVIDVHGCLV